MEALQARRSNEKWLETLIQSFLHRAWQKIRGPERGYMSALGVVAHVFSRPSVHQRQTRGGMGKKVSGHLIIGTSRSVTKPAEPSLDDRFLTNIEKESIYK